MLDNHLTGVTVQIPLIEALSMKLYAKKNLTSMSTIYRKAVKEFIDNNADIGELRKKLSMLSKKELLEVMKKLEEV